jgi:hypothetical protein
MKLFLNSPNRTLFIQLEKSYLSKDIVILVCVRYMFLRTALVHSGPRTICVTLVFKNLQDLTVPVICTES